MLTTITTATTTAATAGATTTLKSGFAIDTSEAKIKLPTETLNGSINISINCTDFQLENVTIAIRPLVRNPTTAGDYVFTTDDGNTATVKLVTTIPCELAEQSFFKKSSRGYNLNA